VVGAALGALLVHATLIEPYRVHLEEVDVALAGLPADLEGFRILHLSDLESHEQGTREEQLAALGRAASADLVVVTGDLVSKRLRGEARVRAGREVAALVGGLPSRLGTWLVEGHGERMDPVARRALLEAVRELGVRYLEDDVAVVPVGDAELALAGLRVHGFTKDPSFHVDPDGSVIQNGRSSPGAHLVLDPAGSPLPRTYDFTGEFRFSREEAGIGVTFDNRMLQRQDRFYRMRRTESGGVMQLSPHGTVFSRGRSASGVFPGPGRWHGFRVRVEGVEDAKRVRARVWPADLEEPETWSIDCVDATQDRISGGAVGVWTSGPGRKAFRHLRVEGPGKRALLAGGLRDDGEPARWRRPDAPDYILAVSEKIPPGAFAIALSHSPDAFIHTSRLGWPLLLAGHTQGGQIRLPFVGALTTDTALGRRYAAGLFRRTGSTLYITRGIGTSRIPLRFLSPPELTLLTLRHATAGAEAAP
jgi:predicted MPP superfamily phosphohydrolase